MAVKPAFRRQGIATSLLHAVDDMADTMGAAYLCLFCEAGNRGATRLYEQAGYHSVGSSPSVETFAAALGLTASKVYGFMYRPLASSLPTRRQRVGRGEGNGEVGEEEEGEEEYVISSSKGAPRNWVRAVKAKGPSMMPGQSGLLGRMGQRTFSWW
jgi:hypothetical protein